MSTDPDSRTGFGPYLQGVGPVYEDNGISKTIRFGVVEDLERALELHGKHVAAFLVEPIQGEAGYVSLFLQNLIWVTSGSLLGLSSQNWVTLPVYMNFASSTESCLFVTKSKQCVFSSRWNYTENDN